MASVPNEAADCPNCGAADEFDPDGKCLNCRESFWEGVAEAIRRSGDTRRYPKQGVPSVETVLDDNRWVQADLGFPKGQLADYRRSLEDGTGLHVREYEDHYEVHQDAVDPRRNPLGHVLIDAPQVAVGGVVAAGILYRTAKWGSSRGSLRSSITRHPKALLSRVSRE